MEVMRVAAKKKAKTAKKAKTWGEKKK